MTLLLGERGSWRVHHHAAPAPLAGWLIIDLIGDAPSIAEISPAQAAELGALLLEVSAAIRRVTRCARVYLFSFAETTKRAHVHLAPRHDSDPRTRGWEIADFYRAVASGKIDGAPESEVTRVCAVLRNDLNLAER